MLVIAHRGASGYAPENTLAAIELALEQKCDGIEIDVQLTKDYEVIVHHDWNVERTTNGKGEIRDLTLQEIKQLDAGSWFDEKFKGEKILLLEEILETVPKSILLNIEMKSKATDERELEKKVAGILKKYDRIDNTIISSFNHYSINKIKELLPEIKTGILYEADMIRPVDYVLSNFKEIYSLHPCNDYVGEKFVKMVKEANLKIYTWTVNDIFTAGLLSKLGIDGIITNYPDIMKKSIKSI
ncbi:MAG: glycerophosphodiester phosphodiesterase [Tepidanaerobacter acetatoxydans]|uniref:glycerophosphodiester phosphodiesterase n=1 Tax=Tepidanaerobacter acetatoxydans TaxID=499229 RepID=UPI0026EE7864|nr:glycerophosphodiester phosphodiesterase [Tepidanaerobacter acetatoxydans]NLU10065.1 glycerophosphodiester phosphodiesterase [Tepidanaerobacter acetatoxydans]